MKRSLRRALRRLARIGERGNVSMAELLDGLKATATPVHELDRLTPVLLVALPGGVRLEIPLTPKAAERISGQLAEGPDGPEQG